TVMKLRHIFICTAVSGFITVAQASPLDLYYERYLQKTSNSPTLMSSSAVEELTFQQFIDHNAPELGTFAQRYFLDESLAKGKDSPVFLYICGEGECEASTLSGPIRDLAKKY